MVQVEEEKNYLKSTAALKSRGVTRNVQPTLTEAQRSMLAEELEARHRRRPAMPKVLNAEERAENRDVLRRMETKVTFLKNPRFKADRNGAANGQPSPFAVSPAQCVFRNYEVGGVYEIHMEMRNTTDVGRRLRILPCSNPMFSVTPLQYEAEKRRPVDVDPSAIVAPGLSASVVVRFAPTTLNDQTEQLVLSTEFGDYAIPVQARRVQPLLDFEQPVNCGCILAGNSTTKLLRITNRGGEGSFRLVAKTQGDENNEKEADLDDEDELEYHYEQGDESEASDIITFVSPSFRVAPAAFFLDAHQSIDLKVYFDASEVKQHTYSMFIEADNGELTPLTLVAITEAVRLELLGWPTLPAPLPPPREEPRSHSPWMLMPWQLNWLQPGTQAGCSSSQEIVISNGGFLPMTVSWHFVELPKTLLSEKRLPMNALNLLNDNIMEAVHRFRPLRVDDIGMEDCPFTVSPQTTTVGPFKQVTFTFSFFAVTAVGRRTSCLAYMAVNDLPPSRKCLLPLQKLISLQQSMQPEGYNKGLPLFGAAASSLVDKAGDAVETSIATSKQVEAATCVAHTLLLQAVATAPKVVCHPPVLALSGDVAPFVAHTRELHLKNTGHMPACFRVRLTSRMPAAGSDYHDPLWVVGAGDIGSMPPQLLQSAATLETAEERRQLRAEQLAVEWPPLGPEGPGSVTMPGFGSLGTAVVEPDEGQIQPGETVVLRVTMRIARESDLDAQLLIDLPATVTSTGSVVKPLSVRVFATARAPRLHFRGTSALDYGVVCAHAQHTLQLQVENPSDLPALVRLRHYEEGMPLSREEEEELFPFESHQEVVQTFVEFVRNGFGEPCIPIEEGIEEAVIKPWVNARSGCLDKSGRRKYRYRGRRLSRGEEGEDESPALEEEGKKYVSDDADFVFRPSLMVLGPHERFDVGVTLRSRGVQKYRALIELRGYDSHHTESVDVVADVQLPRLHLSSQHVHFAPTYVKAASMPITIKLWNDSDMHAGFSLDIPIKLEAGLEVQVDKTEGTVPPHGDVDLSILVVPTRVAEYAELMCRLFTEDLIQPLHLKVTAKVYGLEVDFAVVSPEEQHPVIEHIPRELAATEYGTFPVTEGIASNDTHMLEFGQLPLQTTKELQLVLYNRTGIATPFSAKIERNPAYDPFMKGKTIGGIIDACTRMYSMVSDKNQDPMQQSFSSLPQAVSRGSLHDSEGEGSSVGRRAGGSLKASTRGSSTRFEPKSRTTRKPWGAKRKFLLDDKHERFGFQSKAGLDSMRQKDLREQGLVALKHGRGWAIKVEPPSDWLQPFGKAIITCTCYSDLPGPMEDNLILTVRQLQAHENGDFRIPVKVLSTGQPLYLPGQQTGLDLGEEVPRLRCGTITPLERQAVRRFRVANNSATEVLLSWSVFKQQKLDTPMPEGWIEEVVEEERDPNLPTEEEELEAMQREEDEQRQYEEELRKQQEEEERLRQEQEAQKGKGDKTKKKKEEPKKEEKPTSSQSKSSDKKPRKESLLPEAPATAASPEPVAADGAEDAAADAKAGEGGEAAGEPEVDAEEAGGTLEGAEAAEEEGLPLDDVFELDSGEPPIRIEPQQAVLPVQGSATFTVTMTATKATAQVGSHYFYRLLGKGRCLHGLPDGTRRDSQAPAPKVTVTVPEVEPPVPLPKQVEDLPKIPLEDEALHDDDSDIEQIPDHVAKTPVVEDGEEAPPAGDAPGIVVSNVDGAGQDGAVGLEDATLVRSDPDKDVIATIMLDCVGDCVLPRLTIDKKDDEGAEDVPLQLEDEVRRPEDEATLYCKVFKFIHSSVQQPSLAKARVTGAMHGSTLGGLPLAGVAQNVARQVTLTNHNGCSISCRFRIEGPFKIRQITLVGQKPARELNIDVRKMRIRGEVIPDDPLAQLFEVPPHEAVTVQVDFVPDLVPAHAWTDEPEQRFRGHMRVEYPRDKSADSTDSAAKVDLQHVQLLAISRRPCMKITLVPNPTYDPVDELASSLNVIIEFGRTHVQTSVTRRRVFLLSNISNVAAKWNLIHVGKKRRTVTATHLDVNGKPVGPVDDRDVFVFDTTDGELSGPSREGRLPGTETRMPHYFPSTPALPTAMVHFDSGKFDPAKITVAFRPKTAEPYQSRFRIQVVGGESLEFICRGHGSFDEEDDIMEIREA